MHKEKKPSISINEIKEKIGHQIYRLDRHYSYLNDIESGNHGRNVKGFRSVRNSRAHHYNGLGKRKGSAINFRTRRNATAQSNSRAQSAQIKQINTNLQVRTESLTLC